MVVKRRRRGFTELLFITFQAFSAAAVVKAPPPPPTFALYKNTKQENKKTFHSLLNQCQLLNSLCHPVQSTLIWWRGGRTLRQNCCHSLAHIYPGSPFLFRRRKLEWQKVECYVMTDRKKKTDFKLSEWNWKWQISFLFSSLISSMANNFHLSGGIANWDLASSCCCCESNRQFYPLIFNSDNGHQRQRPSLMLIFSPPQFSAKGSKKGNGKNGKIIKQTVVQVLQKETS